MAWPSSAEPARPITPSDLPLGAAEPCAVCRGAASNAAALLACAVAFAASGCVGTRPVAPAAGQHVVVHSDVGGPMAAGLRDIGDEHVKDVVRFLGTAVPELKAHCHVFRTRQRLQRFLEHNCPRQHGAAAATFEQATHYVVALRPGPTPGTLRRDLRHELTHYVLASSYFDLPPWIDEGLAQYFEVGTPFGQVNRDRLPQVAAIVERRADLLVELVAIPYGERLTDEQYAVAWGLTHFLLNAHPQGLGRVKAYLRHVGPEPEAREVFRQAFGAYPADIEPAWRQYIRAISPHK